MSTTISLENVRREHSRIKNGIAKGQIKVIRYESSEQFLTSLHKIE